MKTLKCLFACCAVMIIAGCNEEVDVVKNAESVKTTPAAALEADLCGKCGCCADCDECCRSDAEKCSCGFNKGSALCCVEGVSPGDGTYCKSCGHLKGTDACCSEDNESCSKCSLAEGSPLCCKLKQSDHGERHEHDEHASEHDGHGEHAVGKHESEHEHGGEEHAHDEHDRGAGGEHESDAEHKTGEHDAAEHDHEGEHVEGSGG